MYRNENVPRASAFGQSRTTPGLGRHRFTPLQRKPGLALLFVNLRSEARLLRAPGILRAPLPIRPRSLRFYLTPIKCTCTLQFGNFPTICGKRLTKLPRMLLLARNPQPLLFRRTTESMSAACGVSMLARLLLRPQERLPVAATAPRLPALKIVCHYFRAWQRPFMARGYGPRTIPRTIQRVLLNVSSSLPLLC